MARERGGIEVKESLGEKSGWVRAFLQHSTAAIKEKRILQSIFYLSESQLEKWRAGLCEGGQRRSEEGRRAE